MTNKQRRAIVNEAKSRGYQGSYVDLFNQVAMNPSENMDMLTASTPEEKEQGLRPLHEAGRTDASMEFKDVPPNTPFNTMGMKAPIDIKKFDEQGHLVKSYENVPPGVQSLDTGPYRGTVLETPSRMQDGGYNPNEYMNEMEPKVFPNQKRDAEWITYTTERDFAGRFPGETRTNREIGLERSNRNTVPLVPNPVRPKELKRAQDGAFNANVQNSTTMQSAQPANPGFLRPNLTQNFSENTTVSYDDGNVTRNQAFETTKGNRVRGNQTFSVTDPQGNVTTQIDKYRNSRMMGLIPPRSTSKVIYPNVKAQEGQFVTTENTRFGYEGQGTRMSPDIDAGLAELMMANQVNVLPEAEIAGEATTPRAKAVAQANQVLGMEGGNQMRDMLEGMEEADRAAGVPMAMAMGLAGGAPLLAGAASSLPAISSGLSSAGAGINTALSAPLTIGGSPALGGTLTTGNLLNAGFAANAGIRLTGADGGENAIDVLTDTDRSGLDKAEYFGMRGLEMFPIAGSAYRGMTNAATAVAPEGMAAASSVKDKTIHFIEELGRRAINSPRYVFGRPLNAGEAAALRNEAQRHQVHVDKYYFRPDLKFYPSEKRMLQELPANLRAADHTVRQAYGPGGVTRSRVNNLLKKNIDEMGLGEMQVELMQDHGKHISQTIGWSQEKIKDAVYRGRMMALNSSTANPPTMSINPGRQYPGVAGMYSPGIHHTNSFTGRVGQMENSGMFTGIPFTSKRAMQRAASTGAHEQYHSIFNTPIQNYFRPTMQEHLAYEMPYTYVQPSASYQRYLLNPEEVGARALESRLSLTQRGYDPWSSQGIDSMMRQAAKSDKGAKDILKGINTKIGGDKNSLFSKEYNLISKNPADLEAAGMSRTQREALRKLSLLQGTPAIAGAAGIGVGMNISNQE